MDVYEITDFKTGVSKAGVNYLQPSDSFQNMIDGFVYRQVLQSRRGITKFASRLDDESRVYGIFEHILPDGSKESLVTDANFLYKFNTTTGVYDQIPFGGSLAAYAGFNLVSREDYVSGTSYPTASNGARFVFTGKGMDHVFFYSGTDVRDFTNAGDNPNYAAPTLGALTKAWFVFWFNERLNFVVPTIAGVKYSQGLLFSGIRNAAGNGDKFNVSGSGLLQLDTYENIVAASILGNVFAFNLVRSNWIIEKTRDAFNPYFSRKIPGPLGTDASFSAALWADTDKSIGKTGIIGTDNRESLRVDNKIPNFTADEINQEEFDQTYGGFDRINNQFLWAYVDSGSGSLTQDKVLVQNYEFDTWTKYNLRLSCFGQTDLGINLAWNQIDETQNASWGRWDTTEEIWNKIGLSAAVQKTLAGDDLGFIYQLNADYDDYLTSISSITQASQAVLAVDATGIQAGDLVVVQNVEGMTEINNYDPETDPTNFEPYTIITATPTSITINEDSTNFTAATPNTGTISKVISFSADTIPFNPYRSLGRRCYIGYVEFLLESNAGFLKVDVISDQEETPFIKDVLIKPSGTLKQAEWVGMSVDNESNFMTFRLKQLSPATQVKVTSIRIHCQPGGLTGN